MLAPPQALPEDIHTGCDVWMEVAAISCFSRVLAQHSEEGVQPRDPSADSVESHPPTPSCQT